MSRSSARRRFRFRESFRTGETAMLYPHGKGRYQAEAKRLWETLVPDSGQATTVQGELIRCTARLGSESYRNGNANWDEGFVRMANYLRRHLCDGTFDAVLTRQIEEDIALVIHAGDDPENAAYIHEEEDSYTRLSDRAVEWCRRHPEPVPHERDPELLR
jgi:hypothetical protein